MGLFGRKKDEVFGEGEPIKCSEHQWEWTSLDYEFDTVDKVLRCSNCGWDKKHGIVCHICNKGNSKFKKNTIKQESNKLFHPECKDELLTKKKKSEDNQKNPDFTKRQFDFNEGLERVFQISYQEEQKIDVKLFFSQDDWTTFTRNYKEKIKDNFVRLIIEVSKKTNTSLISGGNYDFNDDFSKGYTLFVLMRYSDKKLLSVISNTLRNKKFGCLPTNYSIHAHLNDENPNEDDAKEILNEISTELEDAFRGI